MTKWNLKNTEIKISKAVLYNKVSSMASKTNFYLAIFVAIFVLVAAVRGLPGNPDTAALNSQEWKDKGPFELSPERGRYALTYNIAENGSLFFPVDLARFATPDVGYSNGKYVSLFMPGPSILMIPGYLLGKYFGAAQVGTTLVISFFALLNFGFIYLIAKKLGANSYASLLASIAFLFGSPAFTYAVTLYQHHISTFFILVPIYILLTRNKFIDLACVWFILAFSVVVDIPNFFTAIPIGLYALTRFAFANKEGEKLHIKIKPLFFFTFVTAILPVAFLYWFNYTAHGDPMRLPGSNQQASVIDINGKPSSPDSLTELEKATFLTGQEERGNSDISDWFETRNLLSGLQIHLTSPDRGMLFFTPILFLTIFGMFFVVIKYFDNIYNIFLAIMGINILLYSMWGDPWGGWAFGSRYLIPTYAILSIFLAQLLTKFPKKLLLLIVVLPILLYSIRVNTIGAITTSKLPPKPEVLLLEQLTKKEEKYTYDKNVDILNTNTTKSFVHNTYFKNTLNAWEYYGVLYVAITSIVAVTTVSFYFSSKKTI